MSIISFISKDKLSTIDLNKYNVSLLPPRTLYDTEKNYLVTLRSTSERKKSILEREKNIPLSSWSKLEKCVRLYIISISEDEEIPDELEEVIENILQSNKSFSDRECELMKSLRILSDDQLFELHICYHLRNFI